MQNIELIILGCISHLIDFPRIQRWNSKLFKITNIRTVHCLPEPNHVTPFLNQQFMDTQLADILGNDNDQLRIAIGNCELEDNFYIRRVRPRTAVISVRNPSIYLNEKSISIENFILKNVYEILDMYMETRDLTSERIYSTHHRDTRGCLFDINGDVGDVIYNTEKPLICSQCKSRLEGLNLPNKYVNQLERELKRIRKKKILRLELFIRKYPLVSILLTFLFGVAVNIFSNIVYDKLKK
jgi:hypothetical protein